MRPSSHGATSPPPAAHRLLEALRSRGAERLREVRLRANRTVLWSLTDRGRRLNLHRAFAEAPADLLDSLALLCREGGMAGVRGRRAAEHVAGWEPVRTAIREVRVREADRALAGASAHSPLGRLPHCAGSDAERAWLRTLFLTLNASHFQGGLPGGIPLRFSTRMRSRLGHMRPGRTAEGERVVVEIAVNLHLLKPRRRTLLEHTLLHEMAHAADWLIDGGKGHGPSWKAWARRVGISPTRCVVEAPAGGASV